MSGEFGAGIGFDEGLADYIVVPARYAVHMGDCFAAPGPARWARFPALGPPRVRITTHCSVFAKLGHRVAIDDFGTGYLSVDYLRRFPVDRIKIAWNFIADIGIVSGDDAIVRAALGLAREVGIEVVVENVESAAQLKLLKALGCRVVQGYYFARPLPIPEMTALLRIGKITPANADLVEIAALV
jgi:predicted signal transduction protein with EAL and GGDEF domain